MNEWAKQPDAARWWHGLDDLSGSLWLRADARWLYVTAAIRDADFVPGMGAAGIDKGDSLRVALADASGSSLVQLGLPAGGGVYRRPSPAAPWAALADTEAAAKIDRIGGVTWYRLRVSRALLPSAKLAVNVRANDDDGFGFKQSGTWFPGLDDPAPPADQWWQCETPAAP